MSLVGIFFEKLKFSRISLGVMSSKIILLISTQYLFILIGQLVQYGLHSLNHKSDLFVTNFFYSILLKSEFSTPKKKYFQKNPSQKNIFQKIIIRQFG